MLSTSALVSRLAALNAGHGGVYTTADLAVILDRPHPSRLTEAIAVLLREEVLLRVRRGLYADRLHGYRPEIVGLRWLAPGYLSCEAALDRHGLCQTGILTHTYVTTRLIGRRELAARRLEEHLFLYRHLAPHLFFAYDPADGLLLARPEKAVLDFLYFYYKKQRSTLSPQDIDFSRLDRDRYQSYLEHYRQAGFPEFALRWFEAGGSP